MCGIADQRCLFSDSEIGSLRGLRRAVFARKTVSRDTKVGASDIFLALPGVEGQLTADDLGKYNEYHTAHEIEAGAPIRSCDVTRVDKSERVWLIVNRVRDVLRNANAVVPAQAHFEISHHRGLDRFEDTGAVLITLVNRDYCKKLIVLLPGQSHPEHRHKEKEETFLVAHGSITIDLNGNKHEYKRGDLLMVERGARHSFSTAEGVVMEELSSTHHNDDSYYSDPDIGPAVDRKTFVTYWLDPSADLDKHAANTVGN
jgi:quercetin dioxygenase-like cupin family protein